MARTHCLIISYADKLNDHSLRRLLKRLPNNIYYSKMDMGADTLSYLLTTNQREHSSGTIVVEEETQQALREVDTLLIILPVTLQTHERLKILKQHHEVLLSCTSKHVPTFILGLDSEAFNQSTYQTPAYQQTQSFVEEMQGTAYFQSQLKLTKELEHTASWLKDPREVLRWKQREEAVTTQKRLLPALKWLIADSSLQAVKIFQIQVYVLLSGHRQSKSPLFKLPMELLENSLTILARDITGSLNAANTLVKLTHEKYDQLKGYDKNNHYQGTGPLYQGCGIFSANDFSSRRTIQEQKKTIRKMFKHLKQLTTQPKTLDTTNQIAYAMHPPTYQQLKEVHSLPSIILSPFRDANDAFLLTYARTEQDCIVREQSLVILLELNGKVSLHSRSDVNNGNWVKSKGIFDSIENCFEAIEEMLDSEHSETALDFLEKLAQYPEHDVSVMQTSQLAL